MVTNFARSASRRTRNSIIVPVAVHDNQLAMTLRGQGRGTHYEVSIVNIHPLTTWPVDHDVALATLETIELSSLMELPRPLVPLPFLIAERDLLQGQQVTIPLLRYNDKNAMALARGHFKGHSWTFSGPDKIGYTPQLISNNGPITFVCKVRTDHPNSDIAMIVEVQPSSAITPTVLRWMTNRDIIKANLHATGYETGERQNRIKRYLDLSNEGSRSERGLNKSFVPISYFSDVAEHERKKKI